MSRAIAPANNAPAVIPTSATVSVEPFLTALRAGDLFVDPAYRHDLDLRRVNRFSGRYDRTRLGVLDVSARADGRYAIIDGQLRWAVVERTRGPDEHLVCRVHTGLTADDEAALFHDIGTGRRTTTWWDRWRARRRANDPTVLAIDAVLDRHELRVNPAPEDGNVRAIKALETIAADLGGLPMLDNVFTVLTSAFGRSCDAFDGAIMVGVALVLSAYDSTELDTSRLAKQLAGIPPRQLRARAVALREAHRATVPRLCAAVVVERYNAARGRTIEPFFLRAPSSGTAARPRSNDRSRRTETRSEATHDSHDAPHSPDRPSNARRGGEHTQPSTARARTERAPGDNQQLDQRDVDELDELDESPEVAVPDPEGVRRALANGRGLRWVMDTYGLDYPTAQAIRHGTVAA